MIILNDFCVRFTREDSDSQMKGFASFKPLKIGVVTIISPILSYPQNENALNRLNINRQFFFQHFGISFERIG